MEEELVAFQRWAITRTVHEITRIGKTNLLSTADYARRIYDRQSRTVPGR